MRASGFARAMADLVAKYGDAEIIILNRRTGLKEEPAFFVTTPDHKTANEFAVMPLSDLHELVDQVNRSNVDFSKLDEQ